jgi:small-conductance mechanosensitive channel
LVWQEHMRLKFYRLLGIALLALTLSGAASAASPGLTPTPKKATAAAKEAGVSVKNLEDLAGTLQDEAKRKALLDRIQTLIVVQKGAEKPVENTSPGAAFISMLSEHVKKMTDRLLSMADTLSDLPELKNWVLGQITNEKTRDLWIGLLIKVGIALGVGIGGEYLARLLLSRPRRAVASWKIESYLIRIPSLGARTLLEIIPVAVFAGMAYATLPLTEPDPKVNVIALIIINAYEIWHLVASLDVAVVYGVWAFGVLGGFQFLLKATLTTAVILFAARYAAIGIRKGVEKGFAVNDEVKARFPTLEVRANRYIPVLHTTLRYILYGAVVAMLLQTWGVDIVGLLKTPVGKSVADSAVSIIATLVIALVIWELVSSAFERFLSETGTNGELVERSARARTLLPLLRNFILVVLSTTVVLTVLSEVGVNIAPLLAGAGVIGLAIGFGAQTLMKDIITGAFILFENTIAVGDVVELGSHSGRVEKITIRSIQLRDFAGNVHTHPLQFCRYGDQQNKGLLLRRI